MISTNSSWWQRLRSGLTKTSGQLTGSIATIVVKKKLDQAALDELEEALIVADLGVETAGRLVAHLKRERFGKDVDEGEVRRLLAAEITRILKPYARPIPSRDVVPQVILVCGVNGTGKTTTIGKLAKMATDAGLKVQLAACDTFRAAAVEQLQVWGERNGVPVLAATQGSDPAALAFSAFEQARASGADILMIDTAGRLHNKAVLMDELKKIVRVVKKVDAARRTTPCWCWTGRLGRTPIGRSRSSRRSSTSPGWSSPNSTVPRKAEWWSPWPSGSIYPFTRWAWARRSQTSSRSRRPRSRERCWAWRRRASRLEVEAWRFRRYVLPIDRFW